MHPEDFATYEEWIATFHNLPTFPARDTSAAGRNPTGDDVLGPVPAVAASTGTTAPPPPIRPQAADRFISHPTDEFVRNNLPDELRTTAYLLPADCADIAIVLRHVWLFAHGRTENHRSDGRTWVLGAVRNETQAARTRRIDNLLVNEVSSRNVSALVSPYATVAGAPIRSFASLQPLLHPGDVLVWEHRRGTASGPRTGGHTQTIESIQRDNNGAISQITLLQGNQPISTDQAREIRATGVTESESRLRHAPGRRIERDTISQGADTTDDAGVWTIAGAGETTVLVVAGPPRTAARPRVAQGGQRALTDWVPRFRTLTSLADLRSNLEAALQEARAVIEGGGTIAEADLRAFAGAAGEKLWALATASARASDRPGARADLGNQSHYDTLYRMRAVILSLGGIRPVRSAPGPRATDVQNAFRIIDDQFELAARGATTVGFNRTVSSRTRVLRVLITGFDPFDRSASSTAPSRTRWNPAGAAALDLDGTRVDAGSGVTIAVESVVLPVSFVEFTAAGTREGIVERIIGPLAASVDAVITVSEDPRITTNQVRIEQFAVGTHETGSLRPHRLFPIEPGSAPRPQTPIPVAVGGRLGEAIIESNAPVGQIATDTTDTTHGVNTPAIGPPGTTVPASVTLRFNTPAEAQRAATMLGVTPAPQGGDLELATAAAVRQVISGTTARVSGQEERIRFSLPNPAAPGAVQFNALVLSGPGGSFLSNEVSYRTQRLLQQRRGSSAPLSFHVHTQAADESSPANSAAVRTNTIATLRRVIRATGLEIVRRNP